LAAQKPIALALGGGGARGFAHIGVLRVLEREKIPISVIVGTSMGAVVGAMYAQLANAQAIEEKCHSLLNSPTFKSSGMHFVDKKKISESWFDQLASHIRDRFVINIAANKKAAVGIDRLYEALAVLLEDDVIEKSRIPFAAITADLIDGEEVIINKGCIRDAVAASAALPGFFPPVDLNSRFLIDGAITSPVPIRAARSLAADAKVVAVDVSQSLAKNPKLENVIDVVLRSNSITARCYHDELIKEADVLVQPQVGEFHWTAFDKIDWIIKEGEFAVEEKLPEIIKASRKRYFSFV
jgi:NTE family protein